MNDHDFWDWFQQEMTRQGFRSIRQVERAGNVGNDTISGSYRERRAPTDTVIRAVATAFAMTFEDVQAIAGALPDEPVALPEPTRPTLTLRELWDIVSEMSVEEQRAVLDYALYRRSRSAGRAATRQRRAAEARNQSPEANESGV